MSSVCNISIVLRMYITLTKHVFQNFQHFYIYTQSSAFYFRLPPLRRTYPLFILIAQYFANQSRNQPNWKKRKTKTYRNRIIFETERVQLSSIKLRLRFRIQIQNILRIPNWKRCYASYLSMYIPFHPNRLLPYPF